MLSNFNARLAIYRDVGMDDRDMLRMKDDLMNIFLPHDAPILTQIQQPNTSTSIDVIIPSSSATILPPPQMQTDVVATTTSQTGNKHQQDETNEIWRSDQIRNGSGCTVSSKEQW